MYATTDKAVRDLLNHDLLIDILKLQERSFFANQLLGSLDPNQHVARSIITKHLFKWQEQQARLLASLTEEK